jgi:Zn-dependent protease with chaperone function
VYDPAPVHESLEVAAAAAVALGAPRLLAALTLVALPIAALALRGRAAAAASSERRTPAWFAFWQTYRLCVEGGWIVWIGFVALAGVAEALADAFPGAPHGVLWGAVYYGPPIVLTAVGSAIAQAVRSRLHQIAWTRREVATLAAAQALTRVVPLSLVVVGVLSFSEEGGHGEVWLLAAFASFLVGSALLRRVGQWAPEALAEGALRDRAFALAAQCGAPLKQLFLLPAARTRIANAFAHRSNFILLTDYLVRELPRREVDAVVAHELAHVRLRHPRSLALVWLGAFAGGGLGGPLLVAGLARLAADGAAAAWIERSEVGSAWAGGMVLGMVVLFFVARCFERTADACSAETTGDPEAMISALGRISRLGLMPTSWGAFTETFTTHPSVLRRAQALAVRFAIPFPRMRELLAEGLESSDRYQLPAVNRDGGRVLTSAWKRGLSQTLGWANLGLGALVGVAAGSTAVRYGLDGGRAVALYVAALAVLCLLSAMLMSAIVLAAYGRFRPPLAARLSEALPTAAGLRADFVGLGPAGAPRLYEGHSTWDLGHILLDADGLAFVGDRARFALSRGAVLGVVAGPGHPSWTSSPLVYVRWRDDQGGERVFYLRPFARTAASMRREAGALAARLQDWRAGGVAERVGLATALPAPAWGHVTGLSPRAALAPGALVVTLLLTVLVAWAGLDVSGAVDALPAVACLLAARLVFLCWPFFRWREPRTGG